MARASSLSLSSPTRDADCALSASVLAVIPPPLPYRVSRVSANTGTTMALLAGSSASEAGTKPRLTRSPKVLSYSRADRWAMYSMNATLWSCEISVIMP